MGYIGFLDMLDRTKTMNFAKLTLVLCPAILTALLLLVNPAHASEIATLDSVQTSHKQVADQGLPVHTVGVVSDPQVPRGCACSRCVQASQQTFQLLQGRLPGL